MSATVYIAMYGWIPAVLALFAVLPPRRAVLVAFIAAWMFLPMVSFKFPGIPDYTKISATSMGVLLGVMIFDSGRLLTYRLRFVDVPMLLWCLSPCLSSLSNGLGLYDGISSVLAMVFTWGLPYLIGRLYFSDAAGLRELAIGVFIGGLVYVPFCLWEIRMSPRLHQTIYGFRQHAFGQTKRLGGYRPMVFMQHGLAVGMWMTAASLVGLWLWRTGALPRLWRVPTGWLLSGLLGTAVLCKSSFAIVLLAIGMSVLVATRRLHTAVLVLALVALPPAYMLARSAAGWSGRQLISIAEIFSETQAGSLRTRIVSEDILMDKAAERPIFGWGGWGRGMVKDKHGRHEAIPDGLWIITLSKYGLVGVVAMTLALTLPTAILARNVPGQWLGSAALAPALALGVLAVLYMMDCLLNAMINPVFTLSIGGLAGYQRTLRATARVPVEFARRRALTVGGGWQ
jgi:hypothetical protein